jgi:cyclic-di-AMP phosphodiesterase PgpH
MSAKNNTPEEQVRLGLPDDQLEKLDDPLDTAHFPLWVKFKEKAPGSYKHTQSLINIVDSVAADVDEGLNIEALQLAAMYHDIGKMWFPQAYTENQAKDNIHDSLDCTISYQLLTRHVSDTAAILIANNFPPNVIRIAIQHHGTTVLRAIYEKAKKENPNVSEDLFRYNTEKPSSLEALILMLCDQVEATSRSIYVEQKKDVEPDVFVTNMFNRLMMDGQFDKVETRLENLGRIQKALIRDIAGNFQKRLKYEEDDIITKKE